LAAVAVATGLARSQRKLCAMIEVMSTDWRIFAFGSAVFAALTAILAKVGVTGINSNLATLYRTIVILCISALLVWYRQEWQRPEVLSGKSFVFLVLSGVATGASWLCYFRALQLAPASRVAPIDKFSVVLVVLIGVLVLDEPLTWHVALGTLLVFGGVLLMAF
jgi:bacterial/archaeal transporter family protein